MYLFKILFILLYLHDLKKNYIFHEKNKNIKIYLNIIFYNYFFIYLNKLS